MSGCVLASPAIGRLTQRRPMITLVETYDAGNRAMTLSIDDFRQALDIIGDNSGAEAAIVAQFALDLAVTAQFHSEGGGLDAEDARRLLHLRLARHRAAQHQASGAIH